MTSGRRTGLALLVSGGLHAAALFALPFWAKDAPRPAPVSGTDPVELMRVELIRAAGRSEQWPIHSPAPAGEPLATRPRKKARAVEAKVQPAPTPEPRPHPIDVASAAPVEVVPGSSGEPADPVMAHAGVAESAGSSEGAIGAAVDGGAGGPAGAGAPGGNAMGAEAAGGPGAPNHLAEIHARLADSARRCYPPAARRFRLTGEVQVSFCIDGHGGVTQVAARKSSGSALLDRAAVDCVIPGATPLPGPSTCKTVAVQFRPDR